MSIIGQNISDDGGLYHGFKQGSYHRQSGSREHRGQNMRYNQQLIPEQEHSVMKASLDGKLIQKQRVDRQSAERLGAQYSHQQSAQRKQAELSREQVMKMKAERNCLRNMSSSSEEEDLYRRNGGRHTTSNNNNHRASSGQQSSRRTANHHPVHQQQLNDRQVELIRNTNHHKSQSTWDVNGQDSYRQSQNDMVIHGAHRISYDDSSHYQQEHLKTTVSMQFNNLPNNSGLPPHALHERRMSNTMVDPTMRSSNPGHPGSALNKQSARLSKMRASASQSSLLAKQVDKNGKLDEIIKRSQELRDRRKQSQSRASSRDRQQNNTARHSVVSNGRQSKKAMMQTMLNVPEPQILTTTRPSLVSASGEFVQYPQAATQHHPAGSLTSFAHVDAFEQAAGQHGQNQYQHPFAGPATSRDDVSRSSQHFEAPRQSSLGAGYDPNDPTQRASFQENEVKSKLLNQLSQNLQRQRQRQMKSLGNADEREACAASGARSSRRHNGSRLAEQYSNQELNASGEATSSRPATMLERTLANYPKDNRRSELKSNLQLEYTQPDQLMNTINFENPAEGSRNQVGSFVSSSSCAPIQKKQQQSCKPLKPPKSVKNGKLPKELKQKGSRSSQYFDQVVPNTTKGNQKILFTEPQMSSASKHNNQDYVRYMEGMDLLENDIAVKEQEQQMINIDYAQRQNNPMDGISHSRSRERQTGPIHTDASGLTHCLSQRNVKLSNYQHLMQKQKRMTQDSASQQQSPVPRVVSVQDQYRHQQNQMTAGSHGRMGQQAAGTPQRPRTNTEFQQFLLMQDGIKQIQNAIKNKLSTYFIEIKEYSNLQGQTQFMPAQQTGRSVHEAFDAYRASLKSIQESKERARDGGNGSALKQQLSETGQLSLAQRYDLLKKQSSSVKLREKNRQLKKQVEERRTTPSSAAEPTLEKSIDTVRKTFEEKLRSLKEDFHRNLNEIATVKVVGSNSASKLPDATDMDIDQSPQPLSHRNGIHPAHQPPVFPNSDRGKPRYPPSSKKKHRSYLKEDGTINSGRIPHADSDMVVRLARGGGSQMQIRQKFGSEEDGDEVDLRLKGQDSEVLGASSKIVRILNNDALSRQVCQALQMKYSLKLKQAFTHWQKITRVQRIQPCGDMNFTDRRQIMKSLFDDFVQRQKTQKISAIYKWKAYVRRYRKESEVDNTQVMKSQKKVLKKMRQRLAYRFNANRERHVAKQVLCALIVTTQKSRVKRKERDLRLKFILKQLDFRNRQSFQRPPFGNVLGLFEKWKNQAMISLEKQSSSRAVIMRSGNSNPVQCNYRYSYTKQGSNPPLNNSRTASRGPTGSEQNHLENGANLINLQPFRCAPSALQIGSAGGQYRSASSMQSGSHKSLKGAPAAGASSSQKKQGNQRYGKPAARRYDNNDSYQEEDDDEDDEEPIELSAIVAKGHGIKTGDVSREESVKNIFLDNEIASRSLEVAQNNQSLRDSCLPLEFMKNQTQAIKIENYTAELEAHDMLQSNHPNRSESPSSGSNSQFNKACIIGSPDTNEGPMNDSQTPSSSSRILQQKDAGLPKENDQIQKMRAQLKALQREYQREQDKKEKN